MVHRYSTALSHLVLAVTSFYCWKVHKVSSFVQGAFSIILGNSLIGIWRWGNPEHGDKVDSIYETTKIAQTLFSSSLTCTQLWLETNHRKELAYAPCIASILPMVLYFSGKKRDDLMDMVVGLNIISMAAMGSILENYYAIAAAVSFAFNHFFLRGGRVFHDDDLPAIDIYNYGLCFFSFFVLRAF